jgi:NADH-quinone oxidoreductase subunit H
MDYADITSLISFDQEFMLFKLPLSSLSLLIIALIEMKITPFDTVEAQTEILGGIGTEFSGRGLAFLEISKDLKLLFFVLLTTTLLFGKNDIFLFWMMSLFILFIFTFCQVTTCRYRMDQTFKILVFVLLLVVIEFVRIKYIVW